MSRIKDISGQQFGRLTATRYSHKDSGNNAVWVFTCDCGNEKAIRGSEVVRGATRSCGCLVTEATVAKNTKHGMARTQIYKTWIQMKARCLNPSDVNYKDYGGRGIRVCPEWEESFDTFYSDMGEKPRGMSLDRVDNNKGYSKENCRWTDSTQQQRNKRNSKWWYINGVRYESHIQAAKALGRGNRTIIQWCDGYFCTKRDKYIPPKENCWSELKYGEES